VGNLPVAHATVRHTNMVAETSICRGDEQQKSPRYQTVNWTKYSVRDVVLCSVVSLLFAIKKAAQFSAHGPEVFALMCRGRAEVVVLSGQAWKFPNLTDESQVSHWPRVTAVIIEPADDCDGALSALMPNGAVCREATVYNAMLPK
jgi:hypothetical protein